MTYDGHAFVKYGWGGGSVYHEPDVPSVLCTVSHITLMEVLKMSLILQIIFTIKQTQYISAYKVLEKPAEY